MNDDSQVQTDAPVSPPDFATFMHRYQNMVFTTAARLIGDDSQAEDIAQEVFLRAHQHFATIGTSPTAGGWLKTVTTNLCLNHLQRYRKRWRFFSELRREDDEEDAPQVEFAAPDTFFEAMDASDRSARVEGALAALPDRYRIPIVLYHFEDLSYEEIAARLKISLAKVKTDILRGRAALAKLLTENETLTGSATA
jgi:RNA polymerase sigma-70 factor (ECF subfamily)